MSSSQHNVPSLSQRLIGALGGVAALAVVVLVALAHYRERSTVVATQERDIGSRVAAIETDLRARLDLGARNRMDAGSAGSREMHQLAAAFDAMAAHAQASGEALEERVRERTIDLENAVAELESFSYSVSHDLRSPLRSIDGFALILADGLGSALSEEGRSYLERIREQAQYMGSLIDNLLTLAYVSRTDLDVGAIAHDCIASLRRGDPQRAVEVSVQPRLNVQADPETIGVALRHLFDNAWKFTRDAVRTRIEVGVQERYERAAIFVRDNGVGFDPACVERLFTPFRRLHSPREFSGTGIGLAIVQRVIQRNGGQIWAESQPGMGATFYFTLGQGPR